jgi:hypothetical protein
MARLRGAARSPGDPIPSSAALAAGYAWIWQHSSGHWNTIAFQDAERNSQRTAFV